MLVKSFAVRTLRALFTSTAVSFVWYGTEANREDLVAPKGEAAVYSARAITP